MNEMRVTKTFALKKIADETVLIPVGATSAEFNGLIGVNEVGVSVWNMLQQEVTLDDLVQGVLDEYDVDEVVAREDIIEFLFKLADGGILDRDAVEVYV